MSAALSQRRFLVTGAASGIGRHLVTRLLDGGARVLAADRDGGGLDALRMELAGSSGQLLTAVLDVRNPDDWEQAFQAAEAAWQQVDVLLNVAGVLKPGYVTEITPADIDFHLDINTKGVMLGSVAAVKRMRPRGDGHIINIASLAGIAPVPGLPLYSASKFAVRGFTLAIAQELSGSGVRVTCLCPDAVATPMLSLQVGYEQAALTFAGRRALTVEEIGTAVIDVALTKAPLEIALPFERAMQAKLASAFPRLALAALASLRRKGRARQSEQGA